MPAVFPCFWQAAITFLRASTKCGGEISWAAQIHRQIQRPHEQDIDAFDSRNLIRGVDRFHGFNLDDDQAVGVGLAEVVFPVLAVVGCPDNAATPRAPCGGYFIACTAALA